MHNITHARDGHDNTQTQHSTEARRWHLHTQTHTPRSPTQLHLDLDLDLHLHPCTPHTTHLAQEIVGGEPVPVLQGNHNLLQVTGAHIAQAGPVGCKAAWCTGTTIRGRGVMEVCGTAGERKACEGGGGACGREASGYSLGAEGLLDGVGLDVHLAVLQLVPDRKGMVAGEGGGRSERWHRHGGGASHGL